jgi:hypothetical protein
MTRALAVALLFVLAVPAADAGPTAETVVAQEQQKPAAPKRDCEHSKREEGVS